MIANPVRGRFNAAFFRLVDGYVHRLLGARRPSSSSGPVPAPTCATTAPAPG